VTAEPLAFPGAAIPRREARNVVEALAAGVVPDLGARHIAVGRTAEIDAVIGDLEAAEDGLGRVRFLSGAFGSGKTFLLALAEANALDRNFVVLHADFGPNRYLAGAKEQGLELYRHLMAGCATKSRASGGALRSILERWLGRLQSEVGPAEVADAVPGSLRSLVDLPHGYDFAAVLRAYWTAIRSGDDEGAENCVRWLRGEFRTLTEARALVPVNSIPTSATWVDFLRLIAAFSREAGYAGVLVLLDELVHLYRIGNTQGRQLNYERILDLYNDCFQGRTGGLVILFAGIPESITDPRRGLYSYEALKSRLAPTEFSSGKYGHKKTPVLALDALGVNEQAAVLQRVDRCHRIATGRADEAPLEAVTAYLTRLNGRMGAGTLLTMRDILRGWVDALNSWEANPDVPLAVIVGGTEVTADLPPEVTGGLDSGSEDGFASFTA
jgi:hypothetical protein